MQRIAIIGGGISGLSAALRLRELAPSSEPTLYEASPRLGGALQTKRRGDYLIEQGADMFTTREPWALDLCRRIGLEDQLIETSSEYRRAFIVHRGRLVPVPDGFTLMSPTRAWPILMSPILSWQAKMRLGWEFFVPRRRETTDESLADFSRRRLGREVYERLVQPLIGGIYTADPEKLSMQAALPQFVEMERKHGGLIRAARKMAPAKGRESGARYGSFLAPRDGMTALVQAIADRLPPGCVRLQCPIESVTASANNRWLITTRSGERSEHNGLIVATPAASAVQILKEAHAELAAELSQIRYAGAAVVVLGYRRAQIEHDLDGFGCVAPFSERRRILSVSFSSVKFTGRAPAENVLLRVFVGGACQEELMDLSNDELRELVREELAELLGCTGEPAFFEITRWKSRMPQYHVGHMQRVESIERFAAQLPNFSLAGNAYRGVGIPFCVHSGERAAESLLGAS